jgi:hypothetical protein
MKKIIMCVLFISSGFLHAGKSPYWKLDRIKYGTPSLVNPGSLKREKVTIMPGNKVWVNAKGLTGEDRAMLQAYGKIFLFDGTNRLFNVTVVSQDPETQQCCMTLEVPLIRLEGLVDPEYIHSKGII